MATFFFFFEIFFLSSHQKFALDTYEAVFPQRERERERERERKKNTKKKKKKNSASPQRATIIKNDSEREKDFS